MIFAADHSSCIPVAKPIRRTCEFLSFTLVMKVRDLVFRPDFLQHFEDSFIGPPWAGPQRQAMAGCYAGKRVLRQMILQDVR